MLIVMALALVGAAGLFVGAYFVGRSTGPSDTDAANARAEAKGNALRQGRAKNRRTLDAVRIDAGGPGARRGRAAGVAAGREAAEQQIAAHGAGPTQLPLPLLPTDLVSVKPTGFTVRPSAIGLGNHVGAEEITWSVWGDTASGKGTLTGIDCVPDCADGTPTRTPVTLEASDPQFTPESKRYFAKLLVKPQGQPSFPYRVDPAGFSAR